MRIHNAAVSQAFYTIADLLEIKGENAFRIRAYRTAARTIDGLSQDITDMLAAGEDLSQLPGIGKDLAQKITELVETGHLGALDALAREVPLELTGLMGIAGLGGRRVATLHEQLGITTVDQLEKAAREHKVCKLQGFGERIEKSILEGVEKSKGSGSRILLVQAEEIARSITGHMKPLERIDTLVVAGSYRRARDSVRDLDILATCTDFAGVVAHFLKYPAIARVLAHGGTKTTVELSAGVQVDLRLVPPESFGAALHYFTGSQAHNIAVRKRGVKLGLKINEYGVFRGDQRVAGLTEKEVFESVGLPFIEPELREDTGEIEAAEQGRLPRLVSVKDIRGDLHAHTSRTDGHGTIEQMAAAAVRRGYQYLAITDHSRRVTMAHGLAPDDLAAQIGQIDRINESLDGLTLLKGIEVDILDDGSLDLPDSILKQLDFTVCSVHYRQNLPRQQQTERVIRAMHNRYFTILGHPTGRLINKRPPMEIDMEKVLRTARELGCFLEVNSYPDRLDLTDTHCRMAKEMGVKVSIDTDAHSMSDLDFVRFGVGQARRGWLEPDDVINTRPLRELKKLLRQRR